MSDTQKRSYWGEWSDWLKYHFPRTNPSSEEVPDESAEMVLRLMRVPENWNTENSYAGIKYKEDPTFIVWRNGLIWLKGKKTTPKYSAKQFVEFNELFCCILDGNAPQAQQDEVLEELKKLNGIE